MKDLFAHLSSTNLLTEGVISKVPQLREVIPEGCFDEFWLVNPATVVDSQHYCSGTRAEIAPPPTLDRTALDWYGTGWEAGPLSSKGSGRNWQAASSSKCVREALERSHLFTAILLETLS